MPEQYPELRFCANAKAARMALSSLAALLLLCFLLYTLKVQTAPAWLGYKSLPALCAGCSLLAAYCLWRTFYHLRRAYIIVTRLGLEVLPEFFCERNMLVVTWVEIEKYVILNNKKLILILRDESSLEIKISSLNCRQCRLLDTAIAAQLAKSTATSAVPDSSFEV